MAVKEEILKSSGMIIAKDIAQKTGKKVYDKKGSITLLFSALAITALAYWVTNVRDADEN
jgi:hypothetical protein